MKRVLVSAALALPVAALMACGSASRPVSNGRDMALEESNRQLVLAFYEGVFNKHDVERSSAALAEDYKQHNPHVPDGKSPFVRYFEGYFITHPTAHVDIARSATDGELVYLHVHSRQGPDDRGDAVVDIFRVHQGKIVEHWDVIEPVPQQSANANTMF
ncbi:hypothetical protein FZI85_03905 [Mycobacterium sp. CBMA293]|uniref:nuclear transport factor 2 family protein n=1 Tax=unclassified Mycolicibacterium TaxID=2636767 RepID=UPI0012DF207D|nr:MULTISPECIES: nuclear transport factor 2 family protein [unclassified Mycolicibacterium]MUL47079.1 hypothetical protein [Mycolicibacterium sp. CBMA 360]MUL58456.1 hypothetical protein [Mycolicibacterium sp. CBMA 335]MUL73914.1 hypothetical protein [Mycolicibacterium sp. CBMA 311]MUL93339.1 hypothetical protein [Mycolicibacterium sp. CBMA 230]MUM10182.1 hypothetical protein [Mycolicibacterium sp. CBMA 293]